MLFRALSIASPAFLIANPSGEVDSAGNSLELYPTFNISGRQANRGMEGLAITPDGRYLVGIMQNALLQDNGLNSATPPGRRGLNNRILRIDLQTGATQEYVYTVDAINQGRGVNDLLAINDHEGLVVERDNRCRVPTPGTCCTSPATTISTPACRTRSMRSRSTARRRFRASPTRRSRLPIRYIRLVRSGKRCSSVVGIMER